MVTQPATPAAAGADFVEHYVDADGFHVRYLEAGQGAPLVYLHGAGGIRLSRAHDLLAQQYRVIAFEAPGFGDSAENLRSRTIHDLAASMCAAVEALGLTSYNLMGTSFGGKLALCMALHNPTAIKALVLSSPAAIRPEGHRPGNGALFAHPERQPPRARPSEEVRAKQDGLVDRLRGSNRDPDLEACMATLQVPVLVVFGTEDQMIPSEMGRHYKAILPNCQLVLLYDAGHALDADRPEAFASLSSDFLERHENFVVSQRSTLIHP